MRFVNLTTITVALSVLSGFCMDLAVRAQDAAPAHHDQPVPPPDSLKPGAAPDDGSPTNSPMAQDRAVAMNGVDVACTGIGSAKDDPQWKAWPVKVEFSNGAGQFLAGEHVTLSRGKDKIGDFVCDANWVLVRGPAGEYTVTAALTGHEDKPHSAHFSPPASGQKTVEISFPGMSANE